MAGIQQRVADESRDLANVIQQKPGADCPVLYKEFMIRDVLHCTKEEVNAMSLYEYLSAQNYALVTYVARAPLVGGPESGFKKGPGPVEHVTFSQPKDFDKDPKAFVSRFSFADKKSKEV